ncbi:acyl-CoA dehydrogenase family protein (plasmid) [Sphingobium sp. SJ10-10]|uniref:acyl-CoA dehydrogenase family protein n=1 Tax=unclassified Sphingobium TaxID=2611147 RepID=UPI000C9F97DE|nr:MULTISPECIES: acyl-CoA dehydrogenase family protein [unclassified Sphingobium]MCB4858913.1 acyl-CoA dehydrogenase family protein [Sphingobium sp. PNB]MEC6700764.1 acyl-CoA dehydrogenase family protein [Sphingobium sp. SJ10-10]PNQ04443.1 acyl-CoA dehydrogenase [Sphingobium sp. SA916]
MRRLIFEPEHEQFRDSVIKFMSAEVGAHAERFREQGMVDRELFLKAGEQGLLCTWADEKYGGAGIDDFRFEQIIIEENMRHGDIGFYINLHNDLVAPYIAKLGTEEQKDRWMPGIVSGEKILAVAMTEPSTGSDLAGMRSSAIDKGHHWLLNGAKTYISNGILSDLVIVAARTDPNSRHGLGLFVVERGMEGFERGRKLAKMGMKAQDTAELFFNDVKVPKENVLGDPTQGFKYLARFLAQERLVAAIGFMATAQTAFDITLDYIKERKAFGKPIGAFQNNRFKMATMRAELDAIQTYVDQCVLLLNAGELTAEDASSAKLLASELEGRVMDECVQLHGGAGYMEEYRISRMYTDARISRIFAGTSEIMREIIGRGLGLDERKLS